MRARRAQHAFLCAVAMCGAACRFSTAGEEVFSKAEVTARAAGAAAGQGGSAGATKPAAQGGSAAVMMPAGESGSAANDMDAGAAPPTGTSNAGSIAPPPAAGSDASAGTSDAAAPASGDAGDLPIDPLDVYACAAALTICLIDPVNYTECVRMSAGPCGLPDGGVTIPSAECSQKLADCVQQHPDRAQECNAMLATCM